MASVHLSDSLAMTPPAGCMQGCATACEGDTTQYVGNKDPL